MWSESEERVRGCQREGINWALGKDYKKDYHVELMFGASCCLKTANATEILFIEQIMMMILELKVYY